MSREHASEYFTERPQHIPHVFHPSNLPGAAAAEEAGRPSASSVEVHQPTETCPAVAAQPPAAAGPAWEPTGLALRALRRLFQQEPSSENYALCAKLGEGTFGYAFRGTSSSGDVAVKVLKGKGTRPLEEA